MMIMVMVCVSSVMAETGYTFKRDQGHYTNGTKVSAEWVMHYTNCTEMVIVKREHHLPGTSEFSVGDTVRKDFQKFGREALGKIITKPIGGKADVRWENGTETIETKAIDLKGLQVCVSKEEWFTWREEGTVLPKSRSYFYAKTDIGFSELSRPSIPTGTILEVVEDRTKISLSRPWKMLNNLKDGSHKSGYFREYFNPVTSVFLKREKLQMIELTDCYILDEKKGLGFSYFKNEKCTRGAEWYDKDSLDTKHKNSIETAIEFFCLRGNVRCKTPLILPPDGPHKLCRIVQAGDRGTIISHENGKATVRWEETKIISHKNGKATVRWVKTKKDSAIDDSDVKLHFVKKKLSRI